MKNRLIRALIAGLLVFSSVSTLITVPLHAVTNVTLKIHYYRPAKDYTDYNLWVWPENKDGASYLFTSDDAYGKVATITIDSTATSFGFIVRQGTGWDKKDVAIDRFIEVSGGSAEVWLIQGDETVYTSKPDTSGPIIVPQVGEITVKMHYHRYDSNYTDWNVWAWPYGTTSGVSYPLNSSDAFGQIATFNFDPGVATQLGFIMRQGEWLAKDIDADRLIPLSKVKNKVLEVYLVQGDPKIYYQISDIDMSPKFLGAKLDGTNFISVSTTVPIPLKHDNNEGIVIKNELGEVQDIKMFLFTEGSNATSSSSFTVFLNNDLDLNHRYTITREGYNTISVIFNKVYTSEGFTTAYTYTGDLGATYTKSATTFRLWAPTADSVVLNLYTVGDGGTIYEVAGKEGTRLEMLRKDQGLWELVLDADLNKVYYTYTVSVNGNVNEAVDPYAKAVGVNGNRGMVIDLDSTDPSGWANDKTVTLAHNTDAIIYEMHVRDFSTFVGSGITNKGKFLAFTETGTVNKDGLSTGLDHLVELGITHIHLLPSFDFRTVDETTLEDNNFNWGYDPQNYNVPEGSYSTDPYNGEVRVNEFKQMVMALHSKKIGVIMDVVYNHTSLSDSSDFSKIVPGYYYRYTADGKFSNGSGTGNETASERSMVRKFIVDSVSYWATEYHIDGFRFDLMALHDIETMKQVKDALEAINPSILVYGEGWTGGSSTLALENRSTKINVSKLNDIAVFSDDIRDAIKGNVFKKADKGFVNGEAGMEESVKFGIVASVLHGQVDYPLVKYSKYAYATSPTQVVTYVESHDNLTLWDKLLATNPEATEAERIAMVRLAYGILLTSQGVTFMQAGDDFLRSKGGNENSYNATDAVNQLNWDNKSAYADTVAYFEGLIDLRKSHPAFRMTTAEDIKTNLVFMENTEANTIGYTINNNANGDKWKDITVLMNANATEVTFTLDKAGWVVVVNENTAGVKKLSTVDGTTVTLAAQSIMVLVDSNSYSGSNYLLYVIVAGAFLALGYLAYVYLKKRNGLKKLTV